MKNEIVAAIVEQMECELANATHYLLTENNDLFRYYAGKAEGMRDVLECLYNWDERYATEHIKNMWDIIDENW